MAATTATRPQDVGSAPAATKGRTGPKLRDSCTGCAASKVKCGKEKPTCARCAQRGETCTYTASKRNGRNSQSATKAMEAAKAVETPPPPPPPPPPRPPPQEPSEKARDGVLETSGSAATAPNTLSTSMDVDACPTDLDLLSLLTASSDAPYPLLSPPDFSLDFSSSGTFPYPNIDLDDCFGLSAPLPSLDVSAAATPNRLQNNDALPTGASAATGFGLGADQIFGQGADLTFDSIAAPNPTITRGNSPSFATLPSKPKDCCLTAALGFLKQLSSGPSSDCKFPGNLPKTDQAAPIESVVAENKRILESLDKMLACECAHDGYLIALFCFILLKVIASYDSAARTSASLDSQSAIEDSSAGNSSQMNGYSSSEQMLQPPRTFGSNQVDGKDQARLAAQLAMSELHRVQRLANRLSVHLKSNRNNRNSRPDSTPSSTSSSVDELSAAAYASPLPDAVVDQLESDVRRRLRTASCEMIETLRQT